MHKVKDFSFLETEELFTILDVRWNKVIGLGKIVLLTKKISVLSRVRNRPNQEILVPDWLITSSDWLFTYVSRFLSRV